MSIRSYELRTKAIYGVAWGGRIKNMGGDVDIPPGPWELHKNWRRWFGWDLRRVIYDNAFHDGGSWWQYGRSKRVAREVLQRTYDPTPQLGCVRWPFGGKYEDGEVWNGVQWVSLKKEC